MGAVLDVDQAVPVADLQQLLLRNGLAAEIHGDKSARALCNLSLDIRGIDLVGFFINVGKNRPRPAVQGTVGRSREGDGCGDDLVAFPDLRGQAGDMQCGCSVGAQHGIFCPGNLTELLLAGFNSRTAGQKIAPEHLHHGVDICLIDVLMRIIQLRFPDRLSAQDRRQLFRRSLI